MHMGFPLDAIQRIKYLWLNNRIKILIILKITQEKFKIIKQKKKR